jgi:hypothetical protein
LILKKNWKTLHHRHPPKNQSSLSLHLLSQITNWKKWKNNAPWKLTSTTVPHKRAALTGAALTGAALTGAALTGAALTGALPHKGAGASALTGAGAALGALTGAGAALEAALGARQDAARLYCAAGAPALTGALTGALPHKGAALTGALTGALPHKGAGALTGAPPHKGAALPLVTGIKVGWNNIWRHSLFG